MPVLYSRYNGRFVFLSLSVINLHFLGPYKQTMHKNTMYDILSFNVRGIRDQLKRRNIFTHPKHHSPKIIFLQETYSEPSDAMIWKSEWGGPMFFLMGLNTVKWYAFLFTLRCGAKLIVFLTAIRDEWC